MVNNYPLFFKLNVVRYYYKNQHKLNIKTILSTFNISNGSLYNWIYLYKNGILNDKKLYTKRSKFNEKLNNYIINYVQKRTTFNYRLLILNIRRKFKLKISKSSIYNILKNNNITRKRINIRTIISSKKKLTKEIKEFKIQINKIDHNKIVSIDETSIDTHINAEYGWGIKGTKLTGIKKKVRKRYTIISAISNSKVIHNKIIPKSANGILFIEFINELLPKLTNERYLLLDNARIHHTKQLKELINGTNYKLIYNVPYMPEYNPIELVFSKMKKYVKSKTNNEKLVKLKQNIDKGYSLITSSNLSAYYKKCLIW